MSAPLPKQTGREAQALVERAHASRRKAAAESGSTSSDKGRLLEDVTLAAGETRTIPHGLGRKLKGWRAERVRASAPLALHVPRETHADARGLRLINDAAAAITFHLWVY